MIIHVCLFAFLYIENYSVMLKKDSAWLIAKTMALILSLVHTMWCEWWQRRRVQLMSICQRLFLVVDRFALARWQLQSVSVILVIAVAAYIGWKTADLVGMHEKRSAKKLPWRFAPLFHSSLWITGSVIVFSLVSWDKTFEVSMSKSWCYVLFSWASFWCSGCIHCHWG